MHDLPVLSLTRGGHGGSWMLAAAPPATTQRVEAGGPMIGPSVGPATLRASAATTAPLAGTTIEPASQPGTQPVQKPGFMDQVLAVLPLVVMAGLVYLLLFRGKQKEEKKRKTMVAEMKKGDRVMTIGGLVAKVVSVEGDDVVLKIDEAANVKATYRKSAIQQVLGGDEKSK
jgi:preprotein translocase subunit YajC